MKFNSNQERRECWDRLHLLHGTTAINKALATFKPDTAKVLKLYYREGKKFTEICTIMGRSITVIRNHHNRGIFKLEKYFNEAERRTKKRKP